MAGVENGGGGRRPIRRRTFAYALPIFLMNDAFVQDGPSKLPLLWRETHSRAPR